MSDDKIGTVFPPRDEWDIAAYDGDEIVAGYRDHCITDAPPEAIALHHTAGVGLTRDVTLRMSRMDLKKSDMPTFECPGWPHD